MPLTKDFKVTIMTRAHRDKAFCNARHTKAINEFFYWTLANFIDLGNQNAY